MDPTQCLRDDHRLILEVLTCFEHALARARDSQDMTAGDFRPFVEFFRGFADEYHHRKEERSLFPALARAGFPMDAGPVGCMLEEHRMGRTHVGALGDAVEAGNRGGAGAMATILAEGDAYIDLLRSHIAKEDGILFEMAANVIDGDEAGRLLREFGDVNDDVEYSESIRRGRAIAEELIDAYRSGIVGHGLDSAEWQ